MMENKTTTVEIADHNGHTVAQMTRDETVQSPLGTEAWVFMDRRSRSSRLLRTTAFVGTVR